MGKNRSESKKHDVHLLLTEFYELFLAPDMPLGQTNVSKHSIVTSGPLIRQPLHHLPVSLQTDVLKEIDRMLK